MNMYTVPPVHEITVEEFEDVAIRRLKMLRELETLKLKGKATEADTRATLKKFAFLDDLAQDNLSHFILRLVYCKNEALRRWFLTQECALFKFRLSMLSPAEKEEFLKANQIPGEKALPEEKKMFEDQLRSLIPGCTTIEPLEFYKVHFTQVLDLVSTRRVFLSRGTAFVERDSLVSLLVTRFRQVLSESLNMTFKARPGMIEMEADRLLPFLNTLSERFSASQQEWDASGNQQVLPAQLDHLATRSFPLCMRSIHFQLRAVHHLKHGGRMQYGLFLKGIGLSLEHALEFWRSEFGQGVGADKFEKTYAYNVRHNYGQEGRRVDYTPYSCRKIITNPGPSYGDHHGCPFKHQDANQLKLTLAGYGTTENVIGEILDLVRNQHYEVACQRYFDATHPGYVSDVPHGHPNKYFKESTKYYQAKEAEKKGEAPVK
eukprot:ANDGO_01048.mRNA.1 putative DNA primase large subunit